MRIPECSMNAGLYSPGRKETRPKTFSRMILMTVLLLSGGFSGRSVLAEVKIIEAESSYSMGDNDSKIDALRIATKEAKRKALELAGTYVENLTEVKNYQLTRDKMKTMPLASWRRCSYSGRSGPIRRTSVPGTCWQPCIEECGGNLPGRQWRAKGS